MSLPIALHSQTDGTGGGGWERVLCPKKSNSSGVGRDLSLVLTVSTHALGCGSEKWVRDTGTALLVSTLSKEQMWLVHFRWITCPGKGGNKSSG